MYLWRKKLFALLFLPLLFLLAGLNLRQNRLELTQVILENLAAVQSGDVSPAAAVAVLENTMVSSLQGRMHYVEGYSYLQKLLDKREFSNFSYIRDEQGMLHYASFFREDDLEPFLYARRLQRLQAYVAPAGTKLLFVVAPAKYVPNTTVLRDGMPVNDPRMRVDGTLFYMNRLGIDTLDLNLYLPGDSLSYEETFFRTDHHWTIPAAFEAARILVDEMNRLYHADLDPEGFYLDRMQYESMTYQGGMLGSMGRRTGINFVGLDDFTALWPWFSMHYQRETLEENGRYSYREGETIGTLILPEVLMRDKGIYSDSQYSLYLNGLRTHEVIRNLDRPDGPKVLMIRDSYFSPVITFIAPLCGEIHAIWSLAEPERIDIEAYVREHSFDYIIMEVYPYNIEERAFSFFQGG